MKCPQLSYDASFDFILSDEQRAEVEAALQHDGVERVRWVAYPMKRFDTVMVEFCKQQDPRAIASAVTFVASTLQSLDQLLKTPAGS